MKEVYELIKDAMGNIKSAEYPDEYMKKDEQMVYAMLAIAEALTALAKMSFERLE